MVRLILRLQGVVQGVGFRPFIYRTAEALDLKGFVSNDTSGVLVEVEGTKDALDKFLWSVNAEKPSLSNIYYQEARYEDPLGYSDFEIKPSISAETPEAVILPDIAVCNDCLVELFSKEDRRRLYPFINCTNCGPRYTIVEKLPYDRQNTTMKNFDLCPECMQEYGNQDDRRFHAQPNACPFCGPHLWLLNSDGGREAEDRDAIAILCSDIKRGMIAAVKGIGGFHLICNAEDENAVALLRRRKRRSEKPFAVIFRDIEQVREYAAPTLLEEALILSPASPVVIVRKKGKRLEGVSPGLGNIGVFLPYTPLHHMILAETGFPLVATSGNLSEEPIVKGNDEAMVRISSLTDRILLHDRPIHRRCDDSVVRVVGDYPQMIRRSRGYVPLPVRLPFTLRRKVLATGGHLKNTFAIGLGDRVILSQHIGDMETPESMDSFRETVDDICSIYRFEPDVIVHDLHPGYETTKWAAKVRGPEKIPLQHHYAHILSCMAENGLDEEVLGISWDGTGYGDDGTLWGGEFLIAGLKGFERAFHIMPLRLIGAEKAVREPGRVGLSILFEIFGKEALNMDYPPLKGFSENGLNLLWTAWRSGLNSPLSSSAGRLFDGAASLTGLINRSTFEAQAAMMLEDRYDSSVRDQYHYVIKNGVIDWRPLFRDLINDSALDKTPSRFINTLAKAALDAARRIGMERVCLSGGVFQNSPLTTLLTRLLREEGFAVYTQRIVPPNDGGLSLGQAYFGGMN